MDVSIQLLLAISQPVVRAGVLRWIEGTEIHAVAQASDGWQAIEMARRLPLQRALLDFGLTTRDGQSPVGRIKRLRPRLPVIVLCEPADHERVARALAWGADGVVACHCDRTELLSAIRGAAAAEVGSPETALLPANLLSLTTLSPREEPWLTPGDVRVLRYLAAGESNQQIAMATHVKLGSAKRRVRDLLHKIAVSDRTQAAVWAVRHGLA